MPAGSVGEVPHLLGKRWPHSPADHAEILRCQRPFLDLTGSSADLLVITASWTPALVPGGQDAAVTQPVPDVTRWTIIQIDDGESDGPEFATWTPLWASRAHWPAEDLAPLRAVANDETDGVIICPPATTCLFAPYDGGADIIAATPRATK